MLKERLQKLYAQAVELNHRNIIGLLEQNEGATFLDLGCDDGELTKKFAEVIHTDRMYGVEVVDEAIQKAEERGIAMKKFDLNARFDFGDNFFDVIHANQVIEHLHKTDNFISEIHRILKPGGYAIISTENASSWCNIFASIMGWQIFSLTNISSKKGAIGNPFSLHRDDRSILESWHHIRIYNIRGLKEYFEAFGFTTEAVRGAGYFPLPSRLGNIDTRHSHFMTMKFRKKVR
ncbi:MAG: class I SAM-dependent methyltransferase [Candidatus Kerfeldbacteria bacterium]